MTGGRTVGERLAEALLEADPAFADILMPDGSAQQTMWTAEDGWMVAYTTERVRGGRWHGRFVAMAYKPVGPGSRTGKAEAWRRVYARAFARRKLAKARAMDLYADHSPQYVARHGRWWRDQR